MTLSHEPKCTQLSRELCMRSAASETREDVPMYRIELSPGEQTAFRSIEELAVAIRRGVVTPHARIWHNNSNKWLPIQFHPHYKVAASMQLTPAELVAGPPVKPLELLTLGELVDPPAAPARAMPEPKPVAHKEPRREPRREPRPEARREPVQEIRAAKPEPAKKPKTKSTKSRRSGSGRRSFRLALAGSIAMAGAQLVYSVITSAQSESVAVQPRSHRRLVTEILPEQGSPETTAAAVMPAIPAVVRPSRATPSTSPAAAHSRIDLNSESTAGAATSSLGATSSETATEIQSAPNAPEMAAPPLVNTDSLAPRIVDSTKDQALNGVLRAITAPPASQQKRPKR